MTVEPVAVSGFCDARLQLISELGISLVLDVGANAGQYASRLRNDGYQGDILSFEPIGEAYAQLEATARADSRWHARRLALGDRPGRATLNISVNSYSSSFLPIAEIHVDAASDAAFIGTEEVECATLDSIDLPGEPMLLKMDVQGYEPAVIRGAGRLINRIAAVEAELSLVPLYDGQDLASDVCKLLRERGFVPIAFDVAFSHPRTGEILAVDGLFRRA